MVDKLQKKMVEQDIDVLLVFRSENIYYTSGYYPKVADIPGHVGNELTVVPREGDVTLIVSALEYEGVICATSDQVKVEEYSSWVFIDDGTEKARRSKQAGEIDVFNGINKAIGIVKSYKNIRTIGVELPFLTVPLWKKLTELWDITDIKDSSVVFRDAKRIKTP